MTKKTSLKELTNIQTSIYTEMHAHKQTNTLKKKHRDWQDVHLLIYSENIQKLSMYHSMTKDKSSSRKNAPHQIKYIALLLSF